MKNELIYPIPPFKGQHTESASDYFSIRSQFSGEVFSLELKYQQEISQLKLKIAILMEEFKDLLEKVNELQSQNEVKAIREPTLLRIWDNKKDDIWDTL